MLKHHVEKQTHVAQTSQILHVLKQVSPAAATEDKLREFRSLVVTYVKNFVNTVLPNIISLITSTDVKLRIYSLVKDYLNILMPPTVSLREIDEYAKAMTDVIIHHIDEIVKYRAVWSRNFLIVPYPYIILTGTEAVSVLAVFFSMAKLTHDFKTLEVPLVKFFEYLITYPQVITFVTPVIVYVGDDKEFNTMMMKNLATCPIMIDLLEILISFLGEEALEVNVNVGMITNYISSVVNGFTAILTRELPQYFKQPEVDVSDKVMLDLAKYFPVKVFEEYDMETYEILSRCRFSYPCVEQVLKEKYKAFEVAEVA